MHVYFVNWPQISSIYPIYPTNLFVVTGVKTLFVFVIPIFGMLHGTNRFNTVGHPYSGDISCYIPVPREILTKLYLRIIFVDTLPGYDIL